MPSDAIPSHAPRLWAVVPAAGAGKRMGGGVPKQYLLLDGMKVIERTLARLARVPGLQGIAVAVGAQDEYWQDIRLPDDVPVVCATGGAERCHSVFNGLRALAGKADARDWVLVHDAARPCVRVQDIERLIDTLRHDGVGGLLGLPVTDTMKRAGPDGLVIETVPRGDLWRALTPQMFRYRMLMDALGKAIDMGQSMTDEAAAIEWAGYAPRMVQGHADNIKITQPQDLKLAALYLRQQEEEQV